MSDDDRIMAKPVTYKFWINDYSSESPTQGSGLECRKEAETQCTGLIWRKVQSNVHK